MSYNEAINSRKSDTIQRWASKEAGHFPAGKVDRRTSVGKATIAQRQEHNAKSAALRASANKSVRRHTEKVIKSKTPEGRNLKGQSNYYNHLDSRARNRGEEN